MSPEHRAGDLGWKPDEAGLQFTERPAPAPVLRVLSVIPFMLAGAVGVISLVAWLAVLVFGAGIDRGPVWQWAAGRSPGEALTQVGLLILVGIACAAVVVGSIFATGIGFGASQPPWFWPLSEGIAGLAGLGLLAGRTMAPDTMEAIGLVGRDWYFAAGVVVFSIIVLGMRRRREGGDEHPDERAENHD